MMRGELVKRTAGGGKLAVLCCGRIESALLGTLTLPLLFSVGVVVVVGVGVVAMSRCNLGICD